MANTGVSVNGTKWTILDNGNVDLIFKDGSSTTTNPTSLGMTLNDIIMMFEHQMEQFNAIMALSDEQYAELIEDMIVEGAQPQLPSDYWNMLGLTEIPLPGEGLSDGIAMLPIFMSLSRKGLQNLIGLMGFFPVPTLNSLNQEVIGFQHVIEDGEDSLRDIIPMTMQMAVQLLLGDVMSKIMPMLQNIIRIPLTQQQFDSLIGSALQMGPSRFMQSGIPSYINSGDFAGAGRIRECYNGTNGEYDPAKAHAADTQSLGIQKAADGSVMVDPNNMPSPSNMGGTIPENLMHTPVPGLVDAINSASHTSSKYTPTQMADILYGFSHFESKSGNAPNGKGSSAYGPYHILEGTWIDYTKKYSGNIPQLEMYREKINSGTLTAIHRESLLNLRNDPVISTKVMVNVIDNFYTPELKKRNLPINAGSLWNYHYLPANVSQNVSQQLYWNQVNMGRYYTQKYFTP